MNKRLQDLWQDTLIFWYAVYLRLINTLIRPLPPAPPPSHNHKGAVVATRTTHQPASSNQPNSNILPAYPSNGINSAASTETPLDTQPPIPTSTSTVKVVQRPTPENAFQRNQTLNCPLVRPRLQTPTSSNNYVHRRCASAVPPHNTLTTQLKGDFSRDSNSAAATLRNAILRKEAANVAIHLKTWNPHKDLILVDAEGFNLIHSAASIHSPEILSLVLNAINTPELKSRAAQSPGKNPNRYTPLHIASLKSDVDSSRILIQAGADPNARSKVTKLREGAAIYRSSTPLLFTSQSTKVLSNS